MDNNEIVIDISMSKTISQMRTMVKTVAILAVSTMMFAACGGNASKKQGENAAADIATEAEQQVKEATEAKSVSASWENNDFTKQVPKPDIAITAAGESRVGYSANFNKATLEQVKAYAAKVKAAGFNVGATERDGDTYMFDAKNAAGWSVLISWSAGKSGILISKPK
jgi:hypothetical protein